MWLFEIEKCCWMPKNAWRKFLIENYLVTPTKFYPENGIKWICSSFSIFYFHWTLNVNHKIACFFLSCFYTCGCVSIYDLCYAVVHFQSFRFMILMKHKLLYWHSNLEFMAMRNVDPSTLNLLFCVVVQD